MAREFKAVTSASSLDEINLAMSLAPILLAPDGRRLEVVSWNPLLEVGKGATVILRANIKIADGKDSPCSDG